MFDKRINGNLCLLDCDNNRGFCKNLRNLRNFSHLKVGVWRCNARE